MRLHRPVALLHLDEAAGVQLARLSGLEGFTRSILSPILPQLALELMGSKSSVSLAYGIAAILALCLTLNVGRIEHFIARRWVVTGAIGALTIATAFLMIEARVTLVLGLALVAIGASVFSVTLSLFVMDYIGKASLTRTESKRMVANGLAWCLGPLLGGLLWSEVSRVLPLIVSLLSGLVTLWYFWRLRLGPNPVVVARKSTIPSPTQNIPRYFRQRFLRVAYAITTVRSTVWWAIFVFGPLYAIDAGYPSWMTGGFLSLVAALLFFSPIVQRVADRRGARAVITPAFIFIGVMMVALASLGAPRKLGLVFWVLTAFGAAALDVLGNIPFMKTVKPRERPEMTSVFSSWRDVSALLSPLIAFLVLLVLPFWAYYLVIGGLAFATAAYSTNLPRRL